MTNSKYKPTRRADKITNHQRAWSFKKQRFFHVDKIKHFGNSRHHRKGLLLRSNEEREQIAARLFRWLWVPGRLNWWIGVIFAIGSTLFAVASVLSLVPSLAQAASLSEGQVNATFFMGSIPFTIAAYLQLFQAANAGQFPSGATSSSFTLIGWRPHNIGWLSCALQFTGTILFNFNTLDAMIPSLNWFQQDLLIWAPNIIGSILFLSAGYLAFIETCHAYWAWRPSSVSWWIVFVNLLGCVGFMISAILAIVLPGAPNMDVVHMSIFFTLLGAIGFFIGATLMLPEISSRVDATLGSD